MHVCNKKILDVTSNRLSPTKEKDNSKSQFADMRFLKGRNEHIKFHIQEIVRLS